MLVLDCLVHDNVFVNIKDNVLWQPMHGAIDIDQAGVQIKDCWRIATPGYVRSGGSLAVESMIHSLAVATFGI